MLLGCLNQAKVTLLPFASACLRSQAARPTMPTPKNNSNHLNQTNMKKEVDFTKMYKAAEVKLTYITKVKASHRVHIQNSDDAARLFFMTWDWATIEHSEIVKIILLNRANKVLGVATISQGGLSGSVIDTRIILQYAIKANACAVIMAHNHPSGNLGASDADKRVTRTVKDALKMCDIELLDHLIITYEEKFATIE
jgi:DNA repair protein RadC